MGKMLSFVTDLAHHLGGHFGFDYRFSAALANGIHDIFSPGCFQDVA